MNTIYNNKLIAEFMAEDYASYQKNYLHSWDCLMSVVEKINELDDLRFLVSINHQNCTIDSYDNGDEQMKGQANHRTTEPISINKHDHTTILATYNAVIDFIKWYNQQPK